MTPKIRVPSPGLSISHCMFIFMRLPYSAAGSGFGARVFCKPAGVTVGGKGLLCFSTSQLQYCASIAEQVENDQWRPAGVPDDPRVNLISFPPAGTRRRSWEQGGCWDAVHVSCPAVLHKSHSKGCWREAAAVSCTPVKYGWKEGKKYIINTKSQGVKMKPGGQDFIKPVTPWIVGIRLLCASRIILEKEKNMFAVFPLKKKKEQQINSSFRKWKCEVNFVIRQKSKSFF